MEIIEHLQWVKKKTPIQEGWKRNNISKFCVFGMSFINPNNSWLILNSYDLTTMTNVYKRISASIIINH